VDIESDRREEAIQYVYVKYGRHHAAQVANVITYRARSAVRDMAKALGYSPGQQDAWSKQIDRWGPVATVAADEEHPIPADVLALAHQIGDAPRHLGIHSGGMVICDRPMSEVVPVEHARMKDRTVLLYRTRDDATHDLLFRMQAMVGSDPDVGPPVIGQMSKSRSWTCLATQHVLPPPSAPPPGPTDVRGRD
jgi:error-prone DNA polymerase